MLRQVATVIFNNSLRQRNSIKFANLRFQSTNQTDNRDGLEPIPKKVDKGPVKFTTSEAHLNYKATRNFYSDDKHLPPSHNLVIAGSCMSGIFYLFFLRDDIDNDGGLALFKPIHEQVPQYAIPMLQAAIVENRKLGYDTQKLEKKLAEYMVESEKYGGDSKKLVEN